MSEPIILKPAYSFLQKKSKPRAMFLIAIGLVCLAFAGLNLAPSIAKAPINEEAIIVIFIFGAILSFYMAYRSW
jgi:hypothetical protein